MLIHSYIMSQSHERISYLRREQIVYVESLKCLVIDLGPFQPITAQSIWSEI